MNTDKSSENTKRIFHVLSLVIVAILSTTAGFLVVVFSAGVENLTFFASGEVSPIVDSGLEADAQIDASAEPDTETEEQPPEEVNGSKILGDLSVRPAPRLKLGDPYYWRCWDKEGDTALDESQCDRLAPFERLVASHLGEVVRCSERLDSPDLSGTLSLAIEIRFDEEEDETRNIKIWSSPSSTLKSSETIVSCLRQKIKSLPVKGIRHKRSKYTIFFPVEFLGTKGEGVPVELIMDRVRLREEPVKGKIVARLRKGEPLWVYEISDGWAKIETPDGRKGWIFSDSITLTDL